MSVIEWWKTATVAQRTWASWHANYCCDKKSCERDFKQLPSVQKDLLILHWEGMKVT